MSEETEGDMAAAELAAEAERDNTPAPLPVSYTHLTLPTSDLV